MNGGREFPSDVQDTTLADFYGPAQPKEVQPDEAYLEDWLARCCELIDKHRPQVFWFDWWIEEAAFAPYLRRFAAYYYNRAAEWGIGVAINFKHQAFPLKAAVFDVERGQLTDTRPYFWQTDTAVAKNSWGYTAGQDYKTADSVVHDLVDIVSKNGCLLLNIGPRADGSIPDPDQQILREIGAWLKVNGEAIYGTRAWKVYGEGPTEVVGGSFKDTERAPFTSEDVRFTVKGDTLYAIALGVPVDGKLLIRSLGSQMKLLPKRVSSCELLGGGAVDFIQEPDGLRVDIGTSSLAGPAIALRIRTDE